MAIRPIYISTNIPEKPFIKRDIEFVWVSGTSKQQKYKRRDSLHLSISKKYDINKVLEVSTKSNIDLGVKLSAYNLTVKFPSGKEIIVEDVYQDGKVFDEFGKIVEFKYGNIVFEKDPFGMYYDYIYMLGLYCHKEYHEELSKYDIFTDIEFNPKASLNTQARAAAIWNTLYRNNMIDIIASRDEFKRYYKTTFTK